MLLSLTLALSALQARPSLADAPPERAEHFSYAEAEALDPLGNTKLRPTFAGAARMASLMQIDPSCFDVLASKGVSKAKAIEGLEKSIRATFADAVACMRKYPELATGNDSYLRQWIAQARRTLLTCTKKTQAELHTDGENMASGSDVPDSGFLETPARSYKTTLTYPVESIVSAATSTGDWRGNELRLFHEISHSTHVNNRDDHGSLENIRWDSDRPCSQSVVDDRVEMVAMLCTDQTWSGINQQNAASVIFERINHCGLKKGCEDLFSSETPNLIGQIWTPSDPLQKKLIPPLCSRLYNEGYCRTEIARGSGRWATRKNATLQAFGRQIHQRIDELLPRKTGTIPAKLIALHPELASGLESLKSSRCFTSVFTINADGDLQLNDAMPKAVTSLNDRFAALDATAALEKLERSEECAGEGRRIEKGGIAGLLKDIQLHASRIQRSHSYKWLLKQRYELAENPAGPDVEQLFGVPAWAPQDAEDEVKRWLTPSVYRGYLDALKHYHFESPDFDCMGAGLVPLRNVYDSFERVKRSGQPPNYCPL